MALTDNVVQLQTILKYIAMPEVTITQKKTQLRKKNKCANMYSMVIAQQVSSGVNTTCLNKVLLYNNQGTSLITIKYIQSYQSAKYVFPL